jgi:NDP-sugar pyrophosphorylase family protein
VEAIVMAAGEGLRLRPLTETWPKPVLPIDGRPVIATLLRELEAAGFSNVTVVTGHLAERVEGLIGDGGFALDVSFVRQPEPHGSADAVRRALESAARLPALVTAADTVFSHGDLGRFQAAFDGSGAAGALAVRRDPAPAPPHRSPVTIADGRVERVIDDDAGNPLGAAPLWAFGPAFAPFLENLPGPPFELAEAVQRAIDAGEHVLGVEIGRTRDLTRQLDLIVHNFPYLT